MGWTVEYYEKESGDCPVRKFVDRLAIKEKAKVIRSIELLETFGNKLSSPFVKKVRGKVWELRVSQQRVLYFMFTGRRIILLHAFTKKTRKMPRRAITIAENRMRDVEVRYGDKL